MDTEPNPLVKRGNRSLSWDLVSGGVSQLLELWRAALKLSTGVSRRVTSTAEGCS